MSTFIPFTFFSCHVKEYIIFNASRNFVIVCADKNQQIYEVNSDNKFATGNNKKYAAAWAEMSIGQRVPDFNGMLTHSFSELLN